MRRPRFSLLAVLATLTGCALLAAQYKSPTLILADAITALAALSFPIAVLAVLFSRSTQRAFATGFAIFSLLYFVSFLVVPTVLLPTRSLAIAYDRLHPSTPEEWSYENLQSQGEVLSTRIQGNLDGGIPSDSPVIQDLTKRLSIVQGRLHELELREATLRASHFTILILFGYIGGLVARYFYNTRDPSGDS
jgi:hypothetical protein